MVCSIINQSYYLMQTNHEFWLNVTRYKIQFWVIWMFCPPSWIMLTFLVLCVKNICHLHNISAVSISFLHNIRDLRRTHKIELMRALLLPLSFTLKLTIETLLYSICLPLKLIFFSLLHPTEKFDYVCDHIQICILCWLPHLLNAEYVGLVRLCIGANIIIK